MADQATAPVIDFEKIKAEASKLTPEERRKKLEAFRSRQLLQQKKQQAKGGQAAYNKRRQEEFKLLRQMAIDAGEWDDIETKAKGEAETEFDKWLADEEEKQGAGVEAS